MEEKRTDKHFKNSKCSLEKNEWTNISKTDTCSFSKKQTDNHFEKKATCSFGEIELQNTNGQTFQKKQMQFGMRSDKVWLVGHLGLSGSSMFQISVFFGLIFESKNSLAYFQIFIRSERVYIYIYIYIYELLFPKVQPAYI